MDRHDEKRDSHDSDAAERTGDVLGLGGAVIPKAPGDAVASHDAESVARRRERALEEDTRSVNREDPYRQSPGAAGIDMGAGGRGTDVSGE